MPGPTERRRGIDLLRVLGVVAIVVGHVWSGDGFRLAVYTWHVPVFFLLSGFLWTDGRSWREEVVRRARTLARPYVTWLVVIGAVTLLTLLLRTGDPPLGAAVTMAWGGSGLGRPMSAFWFVTALFGSVVLFRALERHWWLSAAVGVGGVLLCTLAPAVVRATPLSLGLVPLGVLLLLVGRVLRDVGRRAKRPQALGGLLLLAGGVVAVVCGRPVDLKASDLGVPVASLLASALVAGGLILLFDRLALPARVSTATSALATTGFAVVLTHAWVLYLLPDATTDVVAAVIATAAPWACALALARTRTSPWTVGVPAPRPPGGPSTTPDPTPRRRGSRP